MSIPAETVTGASRRLSLKLGHNGGGRLTPSRHLSISPTGEQQVNSASLYSQHSRGGGGGGGGGKPIRLIRLHWSGFPRAGFWLSDLPPRPPTPAPERVSRRRQPRSLSLPRQCMCQAVSLKCCSFILQELSQSEEEAAPLHPSREGGGVRVTGLSQAPSAEVC